MIKGPVKNPLTNLECQIIIIIKIILKTIITTIRTTISILNYISKQLTIKIKCTNNKQQNFLFILTISYQREN